MEVRAPALLTIVLVVLSTVAVPAQASQGTWRTTGTHCVVPTQLAHVAVSAPNAADPSPQLQACRPADAVGLGGARLAPGQATEAVVTASETPQGGTPAAAHIVVTDAAGTVLASETFCGLAEIDLPRAADDVWVLPSPLACGGGDAGARPVWVQGAFDGPADREASEGCADLLVTGETAPGTETIERRACMVDPQVDSGAHCAKAAHWDACVTVEPGRPDELVSVETFETCPSPGPGVLVEVLGGHASACVGTFTEFEPDLPSAEVPPPDGDPAALVPDGETSFGPCANSLGGKLLVLGNGASVCVQAEAGTGGETFNLDLTPCPSGVDPRVDVAGVWVRLCIRAHTVTDLGDVPDVGPRDLLPIVDSLRPDVSTEPCSGGVDPGVTWFGIGAHICLRVQAQPPASAETCSGGLGGTVHVAGSKAGACLS